MNANATRNPLRASRHQSGVGLIEVLVTVVVISVGLLGIAGLQLVSLRDSHASAVRTQATAAADFIIDRMRANKPDVEAGLYTVALGATPSSTTRAGTDVAEWKELLTRSLTGSPDGSIAVNGSVVTITIQWGERETDSQGRVNTIANLTFTTSTEI